MEKNGKTLSNFPIEVSGRKCLKFGVSEFLSLLNLLPLRKNCTSTPGFRNIGVKYWVLVLKTLRVARIMDLSVGIAWCQNPCPYLIAVFYNPHHCVCSMTQHICFPSSTTTSLEHIFSMLIQNILLKYSL